MTEIKESMTTPVWGEYDLIVAGGGVAGCCAAVQARRAGVERVLLLEKSYVLGGLATQGLIVLYEPLDDGKGKRITYGMAEELFRRFAELGPVKIPEAWEDFPDRVPEGSGRCKSFYSEAASMIALDDFVIESGAEVLFDSRIVGVETDGNVLTGVIVESTEGRGVYKTRAAIDATGDATLLDRMGVPCVKGENVISVILKEGNPDTMKTALASGNLLDLYGHRVLLSNASGQGHPGDLPKMAGVTSKEVTEFMLYERKAAKEHLLSVPYPKQQKDILQLPTMPQLRVIRHIDAAYTPVDADINTHIADSVSPVADFLHSGDWLELPYRSLYHPAYPNVWAAGRTAAADGWAWMVARVIPGVAATGQAAGMAAALCLQQGLDAATLPYETLAEALVAAGVRLHAED
ncbi:MAG: FAD-dependent oxidoreductase [Clostridia bacterium]|nr:FAD-dependent oxidoreductase [Clostridia bacterium]